MAAALSSSLALKSDGTLWSWGFNGDGRLGIGNLNDQKIPVRIGAESDWRKISIQRSHSLAIKANGTLWSWGANSDGQLGDGTFLNRTTPVQVGSDTDWVEVIAGDFFSYAIKSNGTLWAWGRNNYGQLGDGSTQRKSTPTQIGTDTDWSSLSCGFAHILALKDDGTLWSWGLNDVGQLGDGTVLNKTTPGQIGLDVNWKAIAAGATHSVAVKTDGTLWCWGSNYSGQLGDATLVDKTAPIQIGLEDDWVKIDGGYSSTMAVKMDGTLWGWGYNSTGQLGDGSTENRSVPARIGTDINWEGATVGSSHSLALKSDGTIWAWGSSLSGRLGDGSAWKESPQLVKTTMDIQLSSSLLTSGQAGAEVATFSVVNGSTSYAPAFSLTAGNGADDNATFSISGNKLIIAGAIDLSSKPKYSIRVLATDEFGNSFAKTFILARSNNAPTAIKLELTGLKENEPAETLVGTLSTTDSDAGDTHSYLLVSGEGDTDNSSFLIDGNTLKTAAKLNYETKASYNVRIQSKDVVGATFSSAFVIEITNVNDAPTDIMLSSSEFVENPAIGSALATITTKDEDQSDTHTYTLIEGDGATDNALFKIDGSKLIANGVLDYEAKSAYSIRLKTTDSGGATFDKSFTLTITNSNDSPTDITLSGTVISETLVGGKLIGNFAVADQDQGDSHVLSLIAGEGDADNTLFVIEGNKLVTASGLADVRKGAYSIRVQAADQSQAVLSKAFTITAENIKSEQQIAFSLPESVFADEPPLLLQAAASSGLPVSFEVVSGPASIAGNELLIAGAGTVVIKASQPGNDAFLGVSVTKALLVKELFDLAVSVSKSDDLPLGEGAAKLLNEGGQLVRESPVVNGSLLFTGLRPGSYLLEVAGAGADLSSVQKTFYPSAASVELAEAIEVSASTTITMTMLDNPVAGLAGRISRADVYPNPVADQLWIALSDEELKQLDYLRIYTADGTFVGEFAPLNHQKSIVLHLDGDFRPGAYVITLGFKGSVSVAKFLKE